MITEEDNLQTQQLPPKKMSTEEAMAYFDSLRAVSMEEMLGLWKGQEIFTNHPYNGLLDNVSWYGKAFAGPDEVHPIIFNHQGELFSVHTRILSLNLLKLLKNQEGLKKIVPWFSRSARLFKTTESTARLRMVEYRGIVSATMIYDFHPINDVFRKIDEKQVIGMMDMKGLQEPFFFILEKEASSWEPS